MIKFFIIVKASCTETSCDNKSKKKKIKIYNLGVITVVKSIFKVHFKKKKSWVLKIVYTNRVGFTINVSTILIGLDREANYVNLFQ